MNPEVKQKWIDALLSGEYDQERGVLRSWAGFCCLGVLCDLYSKEHPEVEWDVDYFLEEDLVLPKEVMEWAGLDSPVGKWKGRENLSKANDLGASFEEIAEIIKKGF